MKWLKRLLFCNGMESLTLSFSHIPPVGGQSCRFLDYSAYSVLRSNRLPWHAGACNQRLSTPVPFSVNSLRQAQSGLHWVTALSVTSDYRLRASGNACCVRIEYRHTVQRVGRKIVVKRVASKTFPMPKQAKAQEDTTLITPSSFPIVAVGASAGGL